MDEPVRSFRFPSRVDYVHTASAPLARFLRGLSTRRILACRCPECGKVYVPLRATCPTCAVPMAGETELAGTGTVAVFCIVNIPFEGQIIPPPYACAQVILDGADVPIFQLIGGCDVQDVQTGLRVQARWVDDADLGPTMDSIRWFEPLPGGTQAPARSS